MPLATLPRPPDRPAIAITADASRPERREHDRLPLRRAAMLEAGGCRHAVILLDLSEGGVAAEGCGIDTAPGATVALMLDTALIPARVVAVEGGRIHLGFVAVSEAAAAVIADLLATPRPHPRGA